MALIIKRKYEFGGPAGNVPIMMGLPAAFYYLYFCVRFNNGHIIPGADINFTPFNSFLDSIGFTKAVLEYTPTPQRGAFYYRRGCAIVLSKSPPPWYLERFFDS